jgi:hypothetical protein
MLRRADVRASADAGLKPASAAEASLRAVTGCEYDLCQAFKQDQDEGDLVNAASVGARS